MPDQQAVGAASHTLTILSTLGWDIKLQACAIGHRALDLTPLLGDRPLPGRIIDIMISAVDDRIQDTLELAADFVVLDLCAMELLRHPAQDWVAYGTAKRFVIYGKLQVLRKLNNEEFTSHSMCLGVTGRAIVSTSTMINIIKRDIFDNPLWMLHQRNYFRIQEFLLITQSHISELDNRAAIGADMDGVLEDNETQVDRSGFQSSIDTFYDDDKMSWSELDDDDTKHIDPMSPCGSSPSPMILSPTVDTDRMSITFLTGSRIQSDPIVPSTTLSQPSEVLTKPDRLHIDVRVSDNEPRQAFYNILPPSLVNNTFRSFMTSVGMIQKIVFAFKGLMSLQNKNERRLSGIELRNESVQSVLESENWLSSSEFLILMEQRSRKVGNQFRNAQKHLTGRGRSAGSTHFYGIRLHQQTLERVKKGRDRDRKLSDFGVLAPHPELVNEIVLNLTALQEAGIPLQLLTISALIKAYIIKSAPQLFTSKYNGVTFQCSESWVRSFVKKHLNWVKRAATQASQKTPQNAQDLCRDSILRHILAICDEVIPASLRNSSHTYERIGAKQVSTFGKEEKRAFTLVVAASADGTLLPFQAIWQGVTTCSCPYTSAPSYDDAKSIGIQFEPSMTKNHWSSLTLMSKWVNTILAPYLAMQKSRLGLPDDQKSLLQLDVWSVHRSYEFRNWMKTHHPNILLEYVSGGCTGSFSLAILGSNGRSNMRSSRLSSRI
ncbi:hypothetical protein BC834DRAFT_846191 [Gloeopeniophorella convolvens]|nr:hypothetical protein BC834DRAFT_846191 [Gloeopeniophorella convolvens]